MGGCAWLHTWWLVVPNCQFLVPFYLSVPLSLSVCLTPPQQLEHLYIKPGAWFIVPKMHSTVLLFCSIILWISLATFHKSSRKKKEKKKKEDSIWHLDMRFLLTDSYIHLLSSQRSATEWQEHAAPIYQCTTKFIFSLTDTGKLKILIAFIPWVWRDDGCRFTFYCFLW